jgi:predicted dehydrogenase
MHTSWTQWKNLFSFEVFCRDGAAIVDGLGGSYGPERLVVHRRRAEGGAPVTAESSAAGADASWAVEWQVFLTLVQSDVYSNGNVGDGLRAMRLISQIYRDALGDRENLRTRAST